MLLRPLTEWKCNFWPAGRGENFSVPFGFALTDLLRSLWVILAEEQNLVENAASFVPIQCCGNAIQEPRVLEIEPFPSSNAIPTPDGLGQSGRS